MTTFVKQELTRVLREHPFVALLVNRTGKSPTWSWYWDSSLERLTDRISERLRYGWQATFFDRDEIVESTGGGI